MATAKKAAKKKAAPKDDGIYWVVSVRSKLFTWTPEVVFKNKTDADAYRLREEMFSIYGNRGAKVDRVTLEG